MKDDVEFVTRIVPAPAIRGEPLPWLIRVTTDSSWVVSKYLTLYEDSTFLEVTTTAGGSITNHRPPTTLRGTWSLDGRTIALVVPMPQVDPPLPDPSFRREAEWDGDRRLTVVYLNVAMEFVRQSAF